MSKLNAYQRAVKATYANGEFAHVKSIDDAHDVGDTLFAFLMVELSDREGCDSVEDAAQRLESAIKQLSEAHEAIDALSQKKGRFRNAEPGP